MTNFRVVLRLNMVCVGITMIQYEHFQSQDSFYLRLFTLEYTYYPMNMSLAWCRPHCFASPAVEDKIHVGPSHDKVVKIINKNHIKYKLQLLLAYITDIEYRCDCPAYI
jgi:hypothetical protein